VLNRKNKKQLIISSEAKADLHDIFLYSLSNWGLKLADIYLKKIYKSMTMLLNYPMAGKPKDNFFPGYRCLHSERHLILYCIIDDNIEIARILHENYQYQNKRIQEFD